MDKVIRCACSVLFSSAALQASTVQGLPLFGFLIVMYRHAVGILGRGTDPARSSVPVRGQEEETKTTSKPRVRFESTILLSSGRVQYAPCTRSAIIPGARSPAILDFSRWHLILVDPQYGSCSVSPFWSLEYRGGSCIFVKFVQPC